MAAKRRLRLRPSPLVKPRTRLPQASDRPCYCAGFRSSHWPHICECGHSREQHNEDGCTARVQL